MLDLLQHAWGIMPADQPQDIATKVHRGLHQIDMVSDEVAALLLALLEVEGEPAPLAALSPEVRKARTFTTLVQLCLHASQQRPLILEIEDLHWNDTTSEEWLATLGTSLGTAPILVLGTYRPGYRPLWLDTSYATQLALQPLSLRAGRRLVQGYVPAALAAPPLVQALLAKAAGNPFFLEELARNVREQGAPGLALKVPETVRQCSWLALTAYLQKRKNSSRSPAVCGQKCHFPCCTLWSHSRRKPCSTSWPPYRPPNCSPHSGCFRPPYTSFSMSSPKRSRITHCSRDAAALPAQIAQVLSGQFPETARIQPELLAHHYTEAGHHEQALGYWQRAGEHATQRSAHVEAVAHLSRGLEILRALPDTPARAQSELRLLTRLRLALAVTQGYAARNWPRSTPACASCVSRWRSPPSSWGRSRDCGPFIWHGLRCTRPTNWQNRPSP